MQATIPTSTLRGQNRTQHTPGFGTQIPITAIAQPGCYLCNWSGHLLRVPEDGITPGRGPHWEIAGIEPLFVTLISTDPYIPLTKARMLAAECDLQMSF